MANGADSGGRFARINRSAIEKAIGKGTKVDQVFKKLANDIAKEARSLAPKKSGELAKSIEVKDFTGSRGGPRYLVGSKSKKAAWVHGGADGETVVGFHMIFAKAAGTSRRKGAKLLTFRGTHDHAGKIISVVSVRHPGISSTPKNGNKGTQPFITQAMQNVMASRKF